MDLYGEGDGFQTLYGEVIFRSSYGQQARLGPHMVSAGSRASADQFWTLYGEGDRSQRLYGEGDRFWTFWCEGDGFQTLYGEVIFRSLYGQRASLGPRMVSAGSRVSADQFQALYGEGDRSQRLYGEGDRFRTLYGEGD